VNDTQPQTGGPDAANGRLSSRLSGRTILQVIPDLEAGGAERTTVDVAGAIVAAGGRALVASRGGRLEGELAAAGGELIRIPAHSKNPYGMLANLIRLAQIADTYRVDVIHARSRAPAWPALWTARLSRLPFVTTYHGTYTGKSGLKRFYNSVMARGDVVIANSRFIADHIATQHPRFAERVRVIARGTNMAAFDPAGIARPRLAGLRLNWSVAEDETVILLPARITKWKGHGWALEALAQLTRDEPSLRWVLVCAGDAQGRDAYQQDLEAKADALGLGERVRFVGHVGDMPAALKLADIVLTPAMEPEAFGRVAVEAQAMATPVIAADHGGARETVLTGTAEERTGWRVAPGDTEGLAAALREALDMGGPPRSALGERGQAFVRAQFSLEGMLDATLDVYERLLTERPLRVPRPQADDAGLIAEDTRS